MTYAMSNWTRGFSVLVMACAMAVTASSPAAAQAARNVVCNGCVNGKDVKNNSLRSNDIRNGAIKSVDMQAQRAHLRKSLDHMVYFSIDRQDSDEMTRIARAHSKSGKDIPPTLYECWLGSLIETVRTYDPQFDEDVEIAWRVVLAPGIAYMKLRHAME